MYSPKIREELIPKIYRAAKNAGVHMTTWVNDVLARALSDIEDSDERSTNERKEVDGNGAI